MMNKKTFYAFGAMNVDKKLYLLDDYYEESSNPVSSTQSVGGVIRNVAENLARLGNEVKIFSVYGLDAEAQFIRDSSEAWLDLSGVDVIEQFPTSQYIAVLDKKGDLKTAFANMTICNQMDVKWIEQKIKNIPPHAQVLADLNLSQATLQFLMEQAKQKQYFLTYIPVSASKMKNLPRHLDGLSLLIVNKLETETFLNRVIQNEEDLNQAAQHFLKLGVKRVVITQGREGLLYLDENQRYFFQPKVLEHFVDATGAGDAFSATFIAMLALEKDIPFALECAMTNAYYTIQSSDTVRKNLTLINLLKEREKLYEQ